MNYRQITDVNAYVEELVAAGQEAFYAKKFTCIAARQGKIGEKVISWSVDADGKPIVEKEAEVIADPETGKVGWVATKVDESGEPIVDNNGHTNDWIIKDMTFHEKYEADDVREGIYKPAGGLQRFIKTVEPITLKQWGGVMNVDAGGYINITNPEKCYVISGRDFNDTYKIV